jgi:hypothetical protein
LSITKPGTPPISEMIPFLQANGVESTYFTAGSLITGNTQNPGGLNSIGQAVAAGYASIFNQLAHVSGMPTFTPPPSPLTLTPTWYCGGSQYCSPSGLPTPTVYSGGTTPTPTLPAPSTPFATQPIAGSIHPSIALSTVPQSLPPHKQKHKRTVGVQGLIQQLLTLLNKLLSLLASLLGK